MNEYPIIFSAQDGIKPSDLYTAVPLKYLADSSITKPTPYLWGVTRASIFMPRWASRILLELTEDPREERLMDITEEEARAEGARPIRMADLGPDGEPYGGPSIAYRAGFYDLWDSINAKRGYGCNTNPRVARVAFRMLDREHAA